MNNPFISAQCKNMVAIVSTFERSCKMAATADDGVISKSEAKTLRQISAAAAKFVKELNKL